MAVRPISASGFGSLPPGSRGRHYINSPAVGAFNVKLDSRFRIALGAIAICGTLLSAEPAGSQQAPVDTAASAELTRPEWKVGDSWVVETETDPIQGRSALLAAKLPLLKWKFVVAGEDKVQGADCYRIEVACIAGGSPTKATMWYDKETMFLRQLQTWVYAAGDRQSIVESFAAGGKAIRAPVLPAVNALPLDMPAFPQAGKKSLAGEETFQFKSTPRAAGAKADDAVAFATQVKQKIGKPDAAGLKAIGPDRSKSLTAPVQVDLESSGRSVKQVWQSGRPWPEFSDNGRTRARLLTVERAAK